MPYKKSPSTLRHKYASLQPHLFPVGGDDANVFGGELGQIFICFICLHQLGEILDHNFNLMYIEERWTVGLSLIVPGHSMEDHREILQRWRASSCQLLRWFTHSLMMKRNNKRDITNEFEEYVSCLIIVLLPQIVSRFFFYNKIVFVPIVSVTAWCWFLGSILQIFRVRMPYGTNYN